MIEWRADMFIDGPALTCSSFAGEYRGVEVICGQRGKHRRYGIANINNELQKAAAVFTTEDALIQFIDELLDRPFTATLQEVLRLRALCQHHGLDPNWPESNEDYCRAVEALVEKHKLREARK